MSLFATRRFGACVVAFTLSTVPLDALAAVSVGLSSDNLAPVAGGAAYSYTMTLGNDTLVGASYATLTLPPNARFLGASIAGTDAGRWACETPNYDDNGIVVCEGGILPANSVATVTVVAHFDEGMAGGVRVTTARFTASGQQANAQLLQNVTNDASVSTASDEARDGRRLYRNAQILVAGNSAAIGVLHSEPLPADAELLFLTATRDLDDRCRFDPDAHTVDCIAPQLAPGLHQLTLVAEVEDAMFSDGFE